MADELKLDSRGSSIATAEMAAIYKVDEYPKQDEVFMTVIAHEITHQLIEKRDGAFNALEHTTGDEACIMVDGAPLKSMELATITFFPVVQVELSVKTGEWGTL